MERRLMSVKDRSVTGGIGRSVATVRRSTQDSSVVILDRFIKQILPNREQLRDRLLRTGRKITIGDYLIACAISGLLAAALTAFLFSGSIFISLCAFLIFGVGVPYFVIGYLGVRRRKKFVAQFPEAIDMIVRGIRSGLPVTESMGIVGSEMTKPIGDEFALMADGIRYAAQWTTIKPSARYMFFLIVMILFN